VKKSMLVLAAVILMAPVALADDLIDPPWERVTTPGTTYAEWDGWFDWEVDGDYLPDDEYNPYGQPIVTDDELGTVLDEYAGRYDVLQVLNGDPVAIQIPNTGNEAPDTWKDIYLQITWHWDGAPDIPEISIPATGGTIAFTDEFQLGDGWWYTRYHIHLEPNPNFEELTLWPLDWETLLIDQIVVDTICLPEPASLGGLALGALLLIRRR